MQHGGEAFTHGGEVHVDDLHVAAGEVNGVADHRPGPADGADLLGIRMAVRSIFERLSRQRRRAR